MGCCHSTPRAAEPEPAAVPHQSPSTAGQAPAAPNSEFPDYALGGADPDPDPDPAAPTSPGRRTSRRPSRLTPTGAPSAPGHRPNAPLRVPRRRAVSTTAGWTPRRLARERAAFFDTRVAGRPEVWGALRFAAELLRAGDGATAQGVLDAAGVTLPTGDLAAGAYDEGGRAYALPEWVVADPTNLAAPTAEEEAAEAAEAAESEAPREGDGGGGDDEDEAATEGGAEEVGAGLDKGLGLGSVGVREARADAAGAADDKGKARAPRAGEGVPVRARLSDRAQDVLVQAGRDEPVRAIVASVRQEAQVEARVRLAYMGRVLRDNESLAAQGWQEGHVVNALVFQ